ncbi:MAG: Hpt domain-containing protein [Thermoplasmatota archaeon]
MTAIEARVLSNLLQDLGNDRVVLDSLVTSYLDEAPRLLDEARQAALHHDLKTCERAVHTLKSTSATFGALALAAEARACEHLARQGRYPTTGQLARLESLWGEARLELAAAA